MCFYLNMEGDHLLCSSSVTLDALNLTSIPSGDSYTYQWQVYTCISPSICSYQDIAGATSRTYEVTSSKMVRCHVKKYFKSILQEDYYTGLAEMRLATAAPEIQTQPLNREICLNSSVTFSVTATGSYLDYQWYDNSTVLTGQTAKTLTFTPGADKDNHSYYCKVSNVCGYQNSNQAGLNIILPPTLSAPSAATICQNGVANFIVTPGGDITGYQWEKVYGNPNGTYQPVTESAPFSGTATTNLQAANTGTEHNNYYFRCKAVNSTCATTGYSQPALLTVHTAVSATGTSGNQTACDSSDITFNVSYSGSGSLSVQWQEYITSWSNLAGQNANALTIKAYANKNDRQYRAVVSQSSPCSRSVETSPAILKVLALPAVTVQPADQVKCQGTDAAYSVQGTGAGLNYQWQVKTASGGNWDNLSNTAGYSGVTSNNMSISGVQPGMNTYLYRCILGGSCGVSRITGNATLTVNTPPSITVSPAPQVKCTGQSLVFRGTVSGTKPLEYLWRKDGVGITSWQPADSFALSSVALSDAGKYDFVVRNNCFTAGIESDDAQLTVNSPPSILTNPASVMLCQGTLPSVRFSTSVSGGSLLKWQVKPAQGEWTDLNNDAIYSGVESNELTILDPVSGLNQNQYRCQVIGVCDPPVSTQAALLTVKSQPSIVTPPANAAICQGENHTFTVSASGTAPLYYRWRKSGTSVTDWITDNAYTLLEAKLTDNKNFDVLVKNECNLNGVESDDAALTVRPSPSITLGDTRHICNGETTKVDAGSGYSSYLWSTGETTRSIFVAQQGLYTVTVGDTYGCKNSADLFIITDANLVPLSLGADRSYCKGNTVVLDASNQYDAYLWNNGSTLSTLPVGTTGTYWVRVKNGNSVCTLTDTVNIKIHEPYTGEHVCLITISKSGKNLIVWEKTPGVGIKDYKIYRESSIQGKYDVIGTRTSGELSVFTDMTADPASREYKYKITITDTCNNESAIALSPYHKPIFLQYVTSQGGVLLNWQPYEIENSPVSFESYVIYRGTSADALEQLTIMPGGSTRFTDLDPDALLRRYYYQVAGVLSAPCRPGFGKKSDDIYDQSFSNLENNHLPATSSGQGYRLNTLIIYPNPCGEETMIKWKNPGSTPYTLVVLNLAGETVLSAGNLTGEEFHLTNDGLSNGIYLIELQGPVVYRGKMVVQ
jgi:hypothetical protein